MSYLFTLMPKIKNKWLPADILIALDVFQNAVNHTNYDAIAQFLGWEPATINSIISILELIRFYILARQAANPSKV